MTKEDFYAQIWTSTYGAAFVRYKLYRTDGHNGRVYSSDISNEMCAELAADEADKAVKQARLRVEHARLLRCGPRPRLPSPPPPAHER